MRQIKVLIILDFILSLLEFVQLQFKKLLFTNSTYKFSDLIQISIQFRQTIDDLQLTGK